MKTIPTFSGAACAVGLLAITALSVAQETSTPVKPLEVRKVFANGKHNAFTALRRFKGDLYLAFRASDSHESATADVLVLRSKDGKDWKQVFTFDMAKDDRDPQMMVTNERLFLYCPCMNGKQLTTWLRSTDDGENWNEAVKIYKAQFILWKPCIHDGVFFSTAHRKSNSGHDREVHLVKSTDGVNWEKISTIRSGNWESETTLHFEQNHHAVAFLRQKLGNPPAQVLESDPPYVEWKARPADVSLLGGHSVHVFKGVTYLMSRFNKPDKGGFGSMIYTFAGGNLTPYCQLPAGGDCSYMEAVEDGDNMLVSYYSTHEGTTNIYLAKVPLKVEQSSSR